MINKGEEKRDISFLKHLEFLSAGDIINEKSDYRAVYTH